MFYWRVLMASTTDQILQAALTLPDDERHELIEALIAESEPKDAPPFDECWQAIIRRRTQELDAGTVQAIPWNEVRERVHKRLALDA